MSHETIRFERAQVMGIENKIQNGNCLSRIKVAAAFDAAVAKKMDVQWVIFDGKRDIREGFNELGLAFEMRDFDFKFEVPKMPENVLEISSESAGKFKVMRSGDGKKKPKKLVIKFLVQHHGNPFSLLEWLMKVGGTHGTLTLTSKQAKLPLAEGKPAVERREVAADARFPQPNAHGVYRESDAMSERLNADNKRYARVYVLQVGEKEFIKAIKWNLGDRGHSEPLSRGTAPGRRNNIFPHKDAAFRAALARLADDMEDYLTGKHSQPDVAAAKKIAEWATELAATKYGGITESTAAAGGVQ